MSSARVGGLRVSLRAPPMIGFGDFRMSQMHEIARPQNAFDVFRKKKFLCFCVHVFTLFTLLNDISR
jgi:hypothetical protein